MGLIALIGLTLFAGLVSLFLLFAPRTSAQGALLESLTRESQQRQPGGAAALLNPETLAAPFTRFRQMFSAKPDASLTRRMMLAGYRKPAHADIFVGVRLALPAILGLLVAYFVEHDTAFVFMLTLVVAFFIPDFWLAYAIDRRRERIRLSLPDGLDLLAICMEAGLGLDQAIVHVGKELRTSHPDLSEELLQVNFEQRAGVNRIAAWRSMADRVGLENVRSFVAMLIQTDRFGAPIARSLDSFSDALRTQRRQKAEELAAKTTIKLVPPLVFLIFPSVGIVVVGPAVITFMQNLAHLVR
jgi:tight adherence protein C